MGTTPTNPPPDPTGNPHPPKNPPPVPATAPIKKPAHPKGDDGPTDEQLIDYKENLGI